MGEVICDNLTRLYEIITVREPPLSRFKLPTQAESDGCDVIRGLDVGSWNAKKMFPSKLCSIWWRCGSVKCPQEILCAFLFLALNCIEMNEWIEA